MRATAPSELKVFGGDSEGKKARWVQLDQRLADFEVSVRRSIRKEHRTEQWRQRHHGVSCEGGGDGEGSTLHLPQKPLRLFVLFSL